MLKIAGTYLDVYAGHIKLDVHADLVESGIDSDNIYNYMDELDHISSGIDCNNFHIGIDRQLIIEHVDQWIAANNPVTHLDELNAVTCDNSKPHALVIVEFSKIRYNDDDLDADELKGMSLELQRVAIGSNTAIMLVRPTLNGEILDLSDDMETQSFTAFLVSSDSGTYEIDIS